MPKKKESIFVICAHNDDHIIGAGGTLAKYVNEGKKLYVYIMAFGESSHPHLKREVIIKTRVDETHKADDVLGSSGTFHLGLIEGKFAEEAKERNIHDKLLHALNEKKPAKIFTHSRDDPHPDHGAVFDIVMHVVGKLGYKPEVYSFDIWNPLSVRDRDKPKLVVDITDTFRRKIAAMKCFKSQKVTMLSMIPAVYSRAIVNGLNNHMRYAEVFVKVK